jgi:hypothetical protein
MAGHRPFEELREKMSPERRARIERRVQRTLAELRDAPHTDQGPESAPGVSHQEEIDAQTEANEN